jgi:hypothetical protein
MRLFLSPGWWVIGTGLVLLAGWLVTTYHLVQRRQPDRRRAALIVLNGLAALCLWIMLTQPASRRAPTGSAVLLTAGASASLPQDTRGLPVVTIGAYQQTGISRVSDLAALARNFPRLKHLIVSGHGLPLEDWRQSGNWNIDFRRAELPPGFVDMHWRPELVLGQQLRVSGRINGYAARDWQVRVLDPAGEIAAAVNLGDESVFSLAVQPKLPGAVTYQLLGIDTSGEVALREPLPVWVRRPLPPRVLMSLSRPTVESRFLKNWLSTSTAGLTLETRLAREVRRIESMGDNPPAAELSQDNLESTDLLVVDAGRLSEMGQSQRGVIHRAVSAGLGLLVLMDAAATDEARQDPLLIGFDLQESEVPATPIDLFAGSLQAEPPALHLQARAAEVLLSSDQGTPLFAVRPQGAGQIAVSLLADSFTWGANGHDNDYARLWQAAVAQAARPQGFAIGIERSGALLSVGDAITVCERADSAGGCRRQWVEQTGWQNFGPDRSGVSVYAHGPDQWQAWRAQITQRATRRVAQMASPDPVLEPYLSPRFDSLLLWGLFLVLAGLIWLDHKFVNQES